LGFVELDLALCAVAADQEKTTEFSLPLQQCQDKAGMLILSVHSVPVSAEDTPIEDEKEDSVSRPAVEEDAANEQYARFVCFAFQPVLSGRALPMDRMARKSWRPGSRIALKVETQLDGRSKKKGGFSTLRRIGTKTWYAHAQETLKRIL